MANNENNSDIVHHENTTWICVEKVDNPNLICGIKIYEGIMCIGR